jgi:cyclic beta-1,2-glucan synthetase
LSVANVITSLRLCSEIDWRETFEHVSLVENALRRDPPLSMAHGFLSRDLQRRAVEQIADRTGEAQVQLALSDRVRASWRRGSWPTARRMWAICLVGPGRRDFEVDIAYHAPFRLLLRRLARGTASAISSIAGLSAC